MFEIFTDTRVIFPILSLFLLVSTSLFFATLFRPTNKLAYLLALYLIGITLIVWVELIANSFNLLNQPAYVLLFQVGFGALSLSLWLKSKRPSLAGPFSGVKKYFNPSFLANYLHNNPEILHLLMAIVLVYGFTFIIGFVIPTNTYDAITTHAVRIGYWLQNGNFFPWDTPRPTQISYPVNAQLLLLWTAQMRGSDVLFFLVQWSAAFFATISVAGLGRLLGNSRRQSIFAGLVFLCFPLIILQSNTTQNDLIAAAVFVPSIYFLILGLQTGHKQMLWLSAISLGLSLGTKQTIYFYLPGLFVLVLLVVLKFRATVVKPLMQWSAACILSFILLASYINIANMVNFGHPFGPPEWVGESVGGKDGASAIGNIIHNVPRFTYQFFDNSGLPNPFDNLFHNLRFVTLGSALSQLPLKLDSDLYCAQSHRFSFNNKNYMSEDSAWFGPLAAILLIPLVSYQTVLGIKRRDPWRIGLISTAFIYLVMDAWLRPGWDPYQGRYFIPAIMLVAPFMGSLLRPGWGWRSLSLLVTFVSIFVLVSTLINNPAKPIFQNVRPEKTIWQIDRIAGISLQNPTMEIYARMVAENVPPDAVFGWYADHIIEYPFFGRTFSRTVVPVYPQERLYDPLWLNEKNIEYLLIHKNALKNGLPAGFVLIARDIERTNEWLLLVKP
jgi:4-amino-4-deoxy-L-arabinose transferase-like glycosyltransferase